MASAVGATATYLALHAANCCPLLHCNSTGPAHTVPSPLTKSAFNGAQVQISRRSTFSRGIGGSISMGEEIVNQEMRLKISEDVRQVRRHADSGKFRSWRTSNIFLRSSASHARGLAYHTNSRFVSILTTSFKRNSHLSRLVKISASVEEGVESSETGPTEGSNPQKIESAQPSALNPFAKGKISSRIAAKKAEDAKLPVPASTVQKAVPLKTPAPTVNPQEPKSQLSANAARQLKVSRPPSVFTIPTRPGDEKPISPFSKPAASKPESTANPFVKRPMVPTDWEKAGARPEGSGKKVLDAFKASDTQANTTKFGQPLVPTDIFNDKRRTPEEIAADAFKFEITPGQLVLVGSFLVIIGIMVGTAFLVWKLGGIHYNEY